MFQIKVTFVSQLFIMLQILIQIWIERSYGVVETKVEM